MMVWRLGRGAALGAFCLGAALSCSGKSGRGDNRGVQAGTGGSAGGSLAGGKGGSGGSNGGNGATSAGTGNDGGASPGCFLGDEHHAEGTTWPLDCNTCHCVESEVLCTVKECPPAPQGGTGGGGAGVGTAGAPSGSAGTSLGGASAGNGGSAGSAAGMDGEAGAPQACYPAKIGSFCVIGAPAEDGGVDLSVGMKLKVELQIAGCASGDGCNNDLLSYECSGIGSETDFYISHYACLGAADEPCDGDCDEPPIISCEYDGIVFEEGDYQIHVSSTGLTVEFSVPTHARPGELCAPMQAP